LKPTNSRVDKEGDEEHPETCKEREPNVVEQKSKADYESDWHLRYLG